MSGEQPGVRRTMEQMHKRLRENGASESDARRIARDAALRYDRRVRDGEQRNPVSHGDVRD